jgi:hypothetical protein
MPRLAPVTIATFPFNMPTIPLLEAPSRGPRFEDASG